MKAFECLQCGECCYGEGGIYMDDEEIEKIARFLEMTPEAFISQSCERNNGRIHIKTGPDNFCLYYDAEKSCLIHPVNPKPCSLWPFYPAIVNDKDNWELAKDACPGINPHCPFEEFVRQSRK